MFEVIWLLLKAYLSNLIFILEIEEGERMKKLVHWISRRFAELSGYLLIVMMFLLITDFVSRAMYRPIQGVSELAVFVMVAVVYLGTPHCEQVRGHVNVAAIINRLPQKIKQPLKVMVYWTTFFFLVLFVFSIGRSCIQAYRSNESISGTIPIVVWPVKLSIFIGCFFYCTQVLINSIEEFKKLFQHDGLTVNDDNSLR